MKHSQAFLNVNMGKGFLDMGPKVEVKENQKKEKTKTWKPWLHKK